ncbi:hypothetical protein TNCV_3645671 [Trichonephila clavipes]|nr:hypothetical protein TNCV_3645671 [Trichonephila clavipes]
MEWQKRVGSGEVDSLPFLQKVGNPRRPQSVCWDRFRICIFGAFSANFLRRGRPLSLDGHARASEKASFVVRMHCGVA